MSKVIARTTGKPYVGKMKKVIRDEARMLSLIGGFLVGSAPITKVDDSSDNDNDYFDNEVVVCKGPGHCAMGALMYAAGISNKRIALFEDRDISLGSYEYGPVARKLFDTYHIDEVDANVIISENDSVYDNDYSQTVSEFKTAVKTRAERVLETISKLPARERVRPPLTQPIW